MKEGVVDFSLEGKVIIVTGGTGVLGHAFVRAISGAGAVVGILGRNRERAQRRVEELTARGGRALPLIADVLQEDSLKAALRRVLETYGKIDGLVNAAGGNIPEAVLQPGDDIFSLNVEGMRKAMEINLWGTVLPTLVFGPAIAKSGGGSIVHLSSVSADRTLTRVLGYSMGKAAVESFSKWFAVEMANRFGDKVRMNAIVPGFFISEQNRRLLTQEDGTLTPRGSSVIAHTPFRRFGEPEELAGTLLWLLSDASRFVHGTTITVDGGFSAFSGV